ncbi:unnamed protein product, partial [Laminaria digitata]
TVAPDTTQHSSEGSAEGLVLRLIGLARTRAMRKTSIIIPSSDGARSTTHREVVTERKDFLSYEVHLASFDGRATNGTYSYPFSVLLPPGLPSSMQERGPQGVGCAIAYGFEARLHRPGLLHTDAKAKSQLKVFSRPQETAAAMPVLVGPEAQTVKTCCCFKSGSMSIGFEADRSVVGINEPVRLTVVARNDSSLSVKSMHIEILQVCTWYAHGQKETNTRTVASMIVAGSQLGEVQRAAGEGNQRGRSAIAVDVAARQYLQEMLASGAGTRYELLVPDDCIVSTETGLIDVRHSLSVRLKTPACINSPDVWMPLRVQTGTSGVLSPAKAPPYATALAAESGGDLRPVSVPQSAVTMEFSSELPQ